ncbi:MAG: ATP-binding protein [Magnetococcus sp. YQC-3]
MSLSEQRLIKLHHNRKLFHPEPPSGQDVVTLFQGREDALVTSVETLRYGLDARSPNANDFFGEDQTKKPWIVHGPTRSGKSHLGRRIMKEFEGDARRRAFIFPCRERLEPTGILRDIFEKVCALFHELTTTFKGDARSLELVHETGSLIDEANHFGGVNPPEKVDFQYSRDKLNKLRAEFQAGFPAIIQFSSETTCKVLPIVSAFLGDKP